MKKVFFLFSLLALIVLTGCNSDSEKLELPKMYYSGVETTITDTCQSFILKDWTGKNSCGKFISGKSWKPNGYIFSNHKITKQGNEVSAEFLKSDKKITNNHSDNSDWFKDFFKIISAIIIVALAIWFLWWLFSQKPKSTYSNGKLRSYGGGISSTKKEVIEETLTQNHETKKSFLPPSQETSFPKNVDWDKVSNFLVTMKETGASKATLPGGYEFKIPKNNGMKINISTDGGDIKDTTIKITETTSYNDKK